MQGEPHMSGATVNTGECPAAGMGLAPSTLQPHMPLAMPALLRQHFGEALREANMSLRDIARLVRSKNAPRARLERAIADAWSNLATIERIAGIGCLVSKASTTARFLVVDDSPDMRLLVTRALKTVAPQAAIQTASDARQALAFIEDAGQGAGLTVISDHDMGPGPTGVDLLATIASRHPNSHRILFTGHPTESFDRPTVQAHAILSKDGPDALRRYFGAP